MRARSLRSARRGAVVLFLLLALGVFVGLVALALNLAWLTCEQLRLRQACQAAALAGAAELMDPNPQDSAAQVAGPIVVAAGGISDPGTLARIASARQQATDFAARNNVALQTTTGTAAVANADDDIVAGWVEDPCSPGQVMAPWNAEGPVNTLAVRAVRRRSRGDAFTLWCGRLFGLADAEPAAAARASVDQRVYGFRPVGHVNVPVMPLLVSSAEHWPPAAAGATAPAQDQYGVDRRTGEVRAGADGIGEITLRIAASVAASSSGEQPSGNAWWLSLSGDLSNSGKLVQQVTQGISAGDIAAFGGMLALGADGKLLVPAAAADSSLAGSLQQALWAIRGQSRIWLLGTAIGSGEQRMYQIEGFAAGCIVDCRQESDSALTVVVQPCTIQTCTALVDQRMPRNPWIGKLILNE